MDNTGNNCSSDAEWAVRCDLAACYRLYAHFFGIDDLIYNHLSARVPGKSDEFLIKPYDQMFDEVSASSLVTVDFDGQAVNGGEVNPGGFIIHSAVFRARLDVNAVFHIHGKGGAIVSTLCEGLLPIHQGALQFHGNIAYHDFEGFNFELDERERLAANLGQRKLMILRNHGLLAAGHSIRGTFTLLYDLERACQIQVGAMSTGREIIIPDTATQELTANQHTVDGDEVVDERMWSSLLRLLGRLGIEYEH
jgi:ribulose-5-phosphate 4-epimerase/fuculose-1-phosphate aldolase